MRGWESLGHIGSQLTEGNREEAERRPIDRRGGIYGPMLWKSVLEPFQLLWAGVGIVLGR